MKTKIIPFDLETAKKIQAGEIEGRIVTDSGILVRILCFDRDDEYQIVGMMDNIDIYLYTANGDVWEDSWVNPHKLYIELPEETDNTTITDDWYKTEDVKEKIEFVASKIGLTYEQFIIVMDSLKGIIKINRDMIHLLDDMKEDIERICETPKREFKPFDKVLVRNEDTSAWTCAIFSHMSNISSFPYSASCYLWKHCIPYEGNEHLVGTNDKPKNEYEN